MAALESKRPSSGVLERRSMDMNTPMVSPRLRMIGSCCDAAPLRPRPLRGIPEEGRFGRREGSRPVLGNSGLNADHSRLTIKATASMRPGPQG